MTQKINPFNIELFGIKKESMLNNSFDCQQKKKNPANKKNNKPSENHQGRELKIYKYYEEQFCKIN